MEGRLRYSSSRPPSEEDADTVSSHETSPMEFSICIESFGKVATGMMVEDLPRIVDDAAGGPLVQVAADPACLAKQPREPLHPDLDLGAALPELEVHHITETG
ncbi:hypothetical protein SAY86_025839 [Trapa natans]|uniref:Uncharacterized protein n=1 Tax=Trapa natans TaxID=22666 RepID=A0AAN7QE07_TRANT|nr:hypothetical protein SAY86_025839 [Trapa natans]